MEDQNNLPGQEPDAAEKLRMENELLKAKIIAQFGGNYEDFDRGLSPEIENQFLKNVIAFEEQHKEFKPVKVAELLGDPVFEKEENLDGEKFEKEWNRLQELLEEKSLNVDFIRERDDRFKYRFITEELFQHETDSMMMPGMVCNFIYEEFHPDHEREIFDRAEKFMKAWFERDTEFAEHYLASHFINPDRQILSLEELLKKMKLVFDSYSAFENCQYKIFEIKFQLQEGQMQGLGHAEGAMRYEAILENGERKKIEGPFKLYMSLEYDWWGIFYFIVAGFDN